MCVEVGVLNPHLLCAKGAQPALQMLVCMQANGLVKVMLLCLGWAGDTARGCEDYTAVLRQLVGRDWNDELSPLARTACTLLSSLVGVHLSAWISGEIHLSASLYYFQMWRGWRRALNCLGLCCVLTDNVLDFRMSPLKLPEVLPMAFIKTV